MFNNFVELYGNVLNVINIHIDSYILFKL